MNRVATRRGRRRRAVDGCHTRRRSPGRAVSCVMAGRRSPGRAVNRVMAGRRSPGRAVSRVMAGRRGRRRAMCSRGARGWSQGRALRRVVTRPRRERRTLSRVVAACGGRRGAAGGRRARERGWIRVDDDLQDDESAVVADFKRDPGRRAKNRRPHYGGQVVHRLREAAHHPLSSPNRLHLPIEFHGPASLRRDQGVHLAAARVGDLRVERPARLRVKRQRPARLFPAALDGVQRVPRQAPG